MTNLTANQFDTFIDIISSEDYHAPLWSDDENALRNKGLVNIDQDHKVTLTRTGEQLAKEIKTRQADQDIKHMGAVERRWFVEHTADSQLTDETVQLLAKDRCDDLRLQGVQLLIDRDLLTDRQAVKFAHDKDGRIRSCMVGRVDLLEFADDPGWNIRQKIIDYVEANDIDPTPLIERLAENPNTNMRLWAVSLMEEKHIPLLINDPYSVVRDRVIDRFAGSLGHDLVARLIEAPETDVREHVAREVDNLSDVQIQRLLDDEKVGFWMRDRLKEYRKEYRKLRFLEKLFGDSDSALLKSQRELALSENFGH